MDRLRARRALEKGKPTARLGRKAMGLENKIARLPRSPATMRVDAQRLWDDMMFCLLEKSGIPKQSDFVMRSTRRLPRHITENRRSTRRNGTACVEFAMVAPFLILLIFGSFEFSRMIMVKQSVTNAAREGCREACLITTTATADVDATVRHYLKGSIGNYTDGTEVRVTCSPSNIATLDAGTPITVTVEVDCADISWLPASMFIDATLSSTATMNRE